jgi:hypothetical protein
MGGTTEKQLKVLLAVSAVTLAITGCSAFVPTRVPDSVIASCLRANGFNDGTQYNVEEVFRTDGMDRRVVPGGSVSPDAASAVNSCIEDTVLGDTASALPNVAGVPQTITTQTNGTTVTETFTYGTPPSAAAATSGPARAPMCQLQMTGGTGYSCAIR